MLPSLEASICNDRPRRPHTGAPPARPARPPLRHLTRFDDRIGETQFDGALGGEKCVLGGE